MKFAVTQNKIKIFKYDKLEAAQRKNIVDICRKKNPIKIMLMEKKDENKNENPSFMRESQLTIHKNK